MKNWIPIAIFTSITIGCNSNKTDPDSMENDNPVGVVDEPCRTGIENPIDSIDISELNGTWRQKVKWDPCNDTEWVSFTIINRELVYNFKSDGQYTGFAKDGDSNVIDEWNGPFHLYHEDPSILIMQDSASLAQAPNHGDTFLFRPANIHLLNDSVMRMGLTTKGPKKGSIIEFEKINTGANRVDGPATDR